MEWEIGVGEEASLLDVVAGQHGEVRNGEFEVSQSGLLVWEDGAFGEHGGCRRRHFCLIFLSCFFNWAIVD